MYHKHRCAYDIFMNSFYCLEEDIITFECINETNWCVEKVDFPNFKHTIEKKHTHIHQKKHSAIECLCMIFYSMAYSRRRMLLSIEQYILDICFLNNARFFFIEINLWSCCTFGDYCSQNGLYFIKSFWLWRQQTLSMLKYTMIISIPISMNERIQHFTQFNRMDTSFQIK